MDQKICESCGRTMEFRKKWEKNWENIKYCSDECRKNKNRFDYKKKITELVIARGRQASICPSEVLPTEHKQDSVYMEHVRRSARLLAHEGVIEILQHGKPVDPDSFKGPIRLRIKN